MQSNASCHSCLPEENSATVHSTVACLTQPPDSYIVRTYEIDFIFHRSSGFSDGEQFCMAECEPETGVGGTERQNSCKSILGRELWSIRTEGWK